VACAHRIQVNRRGSLGGIRVVARLSYGRIGTIAGGRILTGVVPVRKPLRGRLAMREK
jgi:hypothetical protein